MERVGAARSFHRGVAIQMQVRFSLQQLRQWNGEYQGEVVAEAFHQGLINFIHDPRNGIVNPQDYSMSMAIHHSTGTHIRGPAVRGFRLVSGFRDPHLLDNG